MPSTITEAVFETYKDRPKAALLMSGSGSNAKAILGNEALRDLYDFVVVASDNIKSKAAPIAQEAGVPAYIHHQDRFASPEARTAYFKEVGHDLSRRGAQIAIYAGFMKITTPDFCEAFPGVNVHPADLSIVGEDGVAKYRGMHALPAMRSEMGMVRSTVHVVDNPVDTGSAISLSRTVTPAPELTNTKVHDMLKAHEHDIYTMTLQQLGQGALAISQAPYSYDQIAELHHA